MLENPLIPFLYILTGFIGLCFGSFATALIYRIPRDISWITEPYKAENAMARSACPNCGTQLTLIDLVPFFSWAFLRGKCRHCKVPISSLYPSVELVTMVLTVLVFYAWGFTPVSAPLMLAVPFLVAAVVIDWEHMILPDDINFALFLLAATHVVALVFQGIWHVPVWADLVAISAGPVFSAIMLTCTLWLVSFVLSKWKGRPALGFGDLKFLPAAGLFMGMAALPSYIGLSGLLGLVTAVIKAKTHKSAEFPFGPALIISLYIHVILTGLGFDYKW